MSVKRSDTVILDHAYGDGKLTGFWGLGTSAACPYGSDQTGPRIAWLDGFAYGVWKGGAKINGSDEEYDGAGLEAFDRPELDIVNIAVDHLHRLSNAIETRGQQDRELDSALKAASKFIRFVRLTRAARQNRPELTKRRNRQERLGAGSRGNPPKTPPGPAGSRAVAMTAISCFPLALSKGQSTER
jgi:hypothetical protein